MSPKSHPALLCLAAALALLPVSSVLHAAAAAPAAPVPGAPLPDLAALRTALTLTETQAGQIAPLLAAQAGADTDFAAAQTKAGSALGEANTKISAILSETQRPQFATLTAPRGGRGGRGNAAPMTDAERAEIAKLSELPPWKAGAGDGDYRIGPDYPESPESLHPLKAGVAMPSIVPAPRGQRGAPAAERPALPAGQIYLDDVPAFRRNNSAIPVGRVATFSLPLAESKFYPGTGMRGARAARDITVYIPAQYVPGTPAPLIVTADAYGAGPRNLLPDILDNMIAAKRVPAAIAVMIANGGGDGGGSERGLEYDTVSGKYAEFVEAEILPRVEKDFNVRITKDPDGRLTLGGSSGGAVAFSMAWFRPDLYRRVVAWSCTLVNQQSPLNPETPHGAWEYHENIVPKSPVKPIRFWLQVGQNDNGSTTTSTNAYHNWVTANARMAAVLKAKGYHYQFIYSLNAGHTPANVINNTYPQALEWAWQGYTPVTR